MKRTHEKRAAEMRKKYGVAKDPQTPAEWQEAVDCAQFLLLLDCAHQYGLIEGGPKVNVDRCAAILERGRERGIYPAGTETLIKRYIGAGT